LLSEKPRCPASISSSPIEIFILQSMTCLPMVTILCSWHLATLSASSSLTTTVHDQEWQLQPATCARAREVIDEETTPALTLLQVKALPLSGRGPASSAPSSVGHQDTGLPVANELAQLASVVAVQGKPAGEVIHGKSDTAIVMLTMYRIVQEFTAFFGVIVLAVGIMSFRNLKSNHQKTEERAPVVRTRVDQLVATSKLGMQRITQRALLNLGSDSGDAQTAVHGRALSTSLDSDEGLPVDNDVKLSDVVLEPCQAWKPIEPQLVLPLCETWYAVKTAELQKELTLGKAGGIDILRPTGYLALKAELRHSGANALILELWQSGGRGNTAKLLMTATALPEEDQAAENQDARRAAFKLADGQGTLRGIVRPSSAAHYVLCNGTEEVMSLSTDCEQIVLSSSHATVASAFWCSGNNIFRGPGHLAICVQPGTDTALAVCCSLSVALLGGRMSSLLPAPPASVEEPLTV